MRACVASLVLSSAVLFPNAGTAQVFQFRTPPPDATAVTASWQVSSDPIVLQGLVFYPTREFRFFDGQVMVQVGVFEGVPIYADTTLEPWSIVYVPVGSERMRTYERARDRELAGTTGSRAPWYPTPPSVAEVAVVERPVGTSGVLVRPSTAPDDIPERTRPTRTRIETVVPPNGAGGVWLDFNGERWYSAGSAVPFAAARFTPIGEYRGFAVYREKNGSRNRIWVSVVQDGPLAPYEKR